LKKVPDYQLREAAKTNGYDSVEAWKQRELQLDARSNIVRDKAKSI